MFLFDVLQLNGLKEMTKLSRKKNEFLILHNFEKKRPKPNNLNDQ